MREASILSRVLTPSSSFVVHVAAVDHWVGMLLDKIDKAGLTDHTFIVMTSDHGEMLGYVAMQCSFVDTFIHSVVHF